VTEIQERLREAREKAQMTQWELADRSKVARSTIARLELGAFSRPQPRTIRALTKALNAALTEAGHRPMPPGWLRLERRHPTEAAS
jgi:transcriptional regulator with XRE-family HTH domain